MVCGSRTLSDRMFTDLLRFVLHCLCRDLKAIAPKTNKKKRSHPLNHLSHNFACFWCNIRMTNTTYNKV